jgi:putative ABC transport system permease protein
MHFLDLVGLSLSALRQQKLRTVLTGLGVVFGTWLLVCSLALLFGVDRLITREYARFHELRRIEVRPGRPAEDGPDGKREIKGRMSEERRERLRKEMEMRFGRRGLPPPELRLTPERVEELAGLQHVVSVQPLLWANGRAYLGERSEPVTVVGASPGDDLLRRRLLLGAMPRSADSAEALVSEYALYQLGVVDEDDVPRALGRKLLVGVRAGRPAPDLLLTLLSGSADTVSASEERLLEKVVERLPEAVGKIGLPEPERKAAVALLKRRRKKPDAAKERVERVTVTVCGVLGPAGKDELRRPGAWAQRTADVVLPERTAEELILRLPNRRENGFELVSLEVDEIDNVKSVQAQVQARGLVADSPLEWVEREQFVYVLVFSSMAVIAVIALIVSALGILNTMLMSVLERTREIGIMKAVGARDRHVLAIFLIEGALIGLVGGLLGLTLAWATSFPANAWVQGMVSRKLSVRLEGSIFAFPPWVLLSAPAFSALVTTLAAWYPAHRAVHVNPIAALRHE